jgi:hypothetical protein
MHATLRSRAGVVPSPLRAWNCHAGNHTRVRSRRRSTLSRTVRGRRSQAAMVAARGSNPAASVAAGARQSTNAGSTAGAGAPAAAMV